MSEPIDVHPSRRPIRRRRLPLLVVLLSLFASLLAVTAAPAGAATPQCRSASSDSDGDGWGWENGKSCKVSTGTSVCKRRQSVRSNGWGWENGRSCKGLVPVDIDNVTLERDLRGRQFWELVFDNPNTQSEMHGFKITKDGRHFLTVRCNQRCHREATFVVRDYDVRFLGLYEVEPIVSGGGLNYSPRSGIWI